MTSRMDQGQYLDRKTFRLNFASYRRNTHTHTHTHTQWVDHYGRTTTVIRQYQYGTRCRDL